MSFRAQQSGVEKSVFYRFLDFGPLRDPPVEMTKAQIFITIGKFSGLRELKPLHRQMGDK